MSKVDNIISLEIADACYNDVRMKLMPYLCNGACATFALAV